MSSAKQHPGRRQVGWNPSRMCEKPLLKKAMRGWFIGKPQQFRMPDGRQQVSCHHKGLGYAARETTTSIDNVDCNVDHCTAPLSTPASKDTYSSTSITLALDPEPPSLALPQPHPPVAVSRRFQCTLTLIPPKDSTSKRGKRKPARVPSSSMGMSERQGKNDIKKVCRHVHHPGKYPRSDCQSETLRPVLHAQTTAPHLLLYHRSIS
ncbi:hypothetical protein LZ30DRAFT_227007 [Colletotrichum cereale]|nr:hypothetical protein LZ30DRAFT_227007 [Colletotrichum cereale]